MIRSFDTPGKEIDGITFLGGSIYLTTDLFQGQGEELYKLSATDGTVQDNSRLFSRPYTGLSNNGTDLLGITQDNFRVEVKDPDDASLNDQVFFFDPASPFRFVTGFQALAFNATTTQYIALKGDEVFQFDEEGQLLSERTLTSGIDKIRGAVFFGSRLYMAEGDTNTIHRALIPQATITITTDPLGMAQDTGGNLYVAVDATPSDRLMRLDPTSTSSPLDTSFGGAAGVDTTQEDVDGVAFHNGQVYVVANDERSIPVFDQFGGSRIEVRAFPGFLSISPTTAEIGQRFALSVQGNPGPAPFDGCGFGEGGQPPPSGPGCQVILQDSISAIESDGTFLYAGVKGTEGIQGAWFKFDPSSISIGPGGFPVAFAQRTDEFEGQLPSMDGFEAFAFTQTSDFPTDRQLVASGDVNSAGVADTIARFNKDTGTMFRETSSSATNGQFRLTGKDIKGLTYVTSTRKLLIADNVTDSILSTLLPENTGVELTGIGNYGTILKVTAASSTTQSTAATYSIVRNSLVAVDLTAPALDFIATTTATTIAGRVNDPAIASVKVGIQLPFTRFVDDPVTAADSNDLWDITNDGSNVKWNISCSGSGTEAKRNNTGPCSWRYGTDGAPGFNNGSRTFGTLTTADPVSVSQDTVLEFFTTYGTEVVSDKDLKLVSVATVTPDLQGNDVTGTFQPILQIVGRGGGDGGTPQPANAHPSFQFRELDPLFINPNLIRVNKSLAAFAGQRIKVRFKFDSVNRFANGGEG